MMTRKKAADRGSHRAWHAVGYCPLREFQILEFRREQFDLHALFISALGGCFTLPCKSWIRKTFVKLEHG